MRYLHLIILLIVLLMSAGCTSQDETEKKEVLISAAASLSDVLAELTDVFEQEHPDVVLSLNYGASGKLAQQISKGAPVDVFLSADQTWMDRLAEQDLLAADTRMNFAHNNLALASSKQKSFSVSSLQELPNLDVKQIALGNPESVPAGKYAEQALKESGVWDAVKGKLVHTSDARQTLTYIESENTEIGFIYTSDLKRSKLTKEVLPIDEALHNPITYPAAVIASSETKQTAKAFLSFLQTDKARSILDKYGFGDER
ncbi:molybdate ABC transporter substrate-binding protein [Lentibacillus lipolyticus]|nr:molybdate ABC transporter substrate-binding protein [Lentibacillus lipolyticus]